ncbi:MAG: ribbon-helix-helix protein, CopG family [Solirubrobacterales bacterium]|nr:ribbon-helix-helix protein, CopG family [Solirubrobacterales bacterium]
MKTAISVPDETFERVERATAKLGISRSEFFARAASKYLWELEGHDVTEAINRALEGDDQEEELQIARSASHKLAQSWLKDE